MSAILIRLFGRFSIHRDGQRMAGSGGGTFKDRAVLAHLALARGRFVARDTLAAAFWPESSQSAARRALSTALWRLRRRLAAAAADADLIQSEGDGLSLAVDTVQVDVLQVLEALERAQNAPSAAAIDRLDCALGLVRGVFLEGGYDPWTLAQRSYLEGRQQTALELIARDHEAAGRYDRAIAFAARLLRADPLHEPMHRVTIRCHLARGNPGAALRQYMNCAAALRGALSVVPDPSTAALVAGLTARTAPDPLAGNWPAIGTPLP